MIAYVVEVLGGDNERGFVIPPSNARALTDQILWCWKHPKQSSRTGEAGRDFVRQNYSDTAMVNRLEAIYERILCPDI